MRLFAALALLFLACQNPPSAQEEAQAEWHQGKALLKTGALHEASRRLESAAVRFRALGDGVGEARVRNDLGAAWRLLGDPGRAREAYQRALDLYRRAGVQTGEATSLNNLGLAWESTGDFQKAISCYEEALALWRRLKKRAAEAATLENLGNVYVLIGHDDEGLDLLRRALALREEESDEHGRMSTLLALGMAETLTGRPEEGLERFREALPIAEETGDRLAEAGALDRQGSALLALGRLDEADDSYTRSLEISRQAGSPRNQAHTLASLAELHLQQGDAESARRELRQALDLLVAVRDVNGEASIRIALSRVERTRGAWGPARQEIDTALARLEELRTGLHGPASRGSFLSTRYSAWEELVVLLMELGQTEQALEAAERARARNLLEALQGERTLTARQIQDLADRDTLLVVYLLAEPASFAWTIDRERIVPHRLPGRKRIETLARRTAAALPRSHERTVRNTAARAAHDLAQAILAPLDERLAGRPRLVILPDGALNLVPFAALPSGESVLLASHEIVLLPSATVLVQQRKRLAGRSPAPGELAVLADPIFSPADPRLPPGRAQAAVESRRDDPAFGFGPLARLPYTREEADAIARLVPSGRRLVVLGAAATRDLATGGALSRYRILHFATHGLLHPVLPERSGLVLSLIDEKGRPRAGFLSAPDVAALDLPADLVVLSACRSGLGRELRGEGLVGLTQAFFRAGARAVIVSSWDVRDRATATLMTRFYENHLTRRLPPAAALREAQLALREDPETAAPSFWAGFALHGDWR